jgi:2-polyprenyl-3-methyl-5-hydroxy-6-metoxy-1,4-benzoquinol methylase
MADSQTVERFEFGSNWKSFETRVDDARVEVAAESLRDQLGDLSGRSFLDAGCGSGLFSLAACRLGAARVHSFDRDPESVEAAERLRARWQARDSAWTIEPGDILDVDYVGSLGQWDIVYSWGVLHHTGAMRQAWQNVAGLVAPGGRLFVSIYNDQGRKSRIWTRVKRRYQRVPKRLRPVYTVLVMAPQELAAAAIRGPGAQIRSWRDYKMSRGMSRWHDLVDWVGGYPFEVARPHEVFEFFHARGFELEWMFTCGPGLGCNQFVLRRAAGV